MDERAEGGYATASLGETSADELALRNNSLVDESGNSDSAQIDMYRDSSVIQNY